MVAILNGDHTKASRETTAEPDPKSSVEIYLTRFPYLPGKAARTCCRHNDYDEDSFPNFHLYLSEVIILDHFNLAIRHAIT